jgi:hypothetical protein
MIRLAEAGIERRHAEALAEAARDFIMAELVTKTDLAASVATIEAKIEAQTLRMTVRLGGIVLAALGALTVLQHVL